MYRKVMIAFDGSDDSRRALDAGVALASLLKAEVVLLAVVDAGIDAAAAEAYASGTSDREEFDDSRALVDQETAQLRQRGVDATAMVAIGNPPEQINERAREIGADLVVIGHRTHGLWSRLANDAVGVRLVKDPPCNVLIVPPKE